MQKIDANENDRLMDVANAIVAPKLADAANPVNIPGSVDAFGLTAAPAAPALALAQ